MRLLQDSKSARSRAVIIEVALGLFSTQGYRGTSIRDLAEGAGLSTGNVYHHFPDKEAVFVAALDRHLEEICRPGSALGMAVAGGASPDDPAVLAHAAQETVRVQGRRMNLVYVDVIEFEGAHLRAFYQGMAERFDTLQGAGSSGGALMRVCRTFLHHAMAEALSCAAGPGEAAISA